MKIIITIILIKYFAVLPGVANTLREIHSHYNGDSYTTKLKVDLLGPKPFLEGNLSIEKSIEELETIAKVEIKKNFGAEALNGKIINNSIKFTYMKIAKERRWFIIVEYAIVKKPLKGASFANINNFRICMNLAGEPFPIKKNEPRQEVNPNRHRTEDETEEQIKPFKQN